MHKQGFFVWILLLGYVRGNYEFTVNFGASTEGVCDWSTQHNLGIVMNPFCTPNIESCVTAVDASQRICVEQVSDIPFPHHGMYWYDGAECTGTPRSVTATRINYCFAVVSGSHSKSIFCNATHIVHQSWNTTSTCTGTPSTTVTTGRNVCIPSSNGDYSFYYECF